MPALSSTKIKFKYEEVDWYEFKLSIQKKIEEDSKDKTFFEKYKIKEKDFLIFKEKAFNTKEKQSFLTSRTMYFIH